ncbi:MULTISPECIES: DUF3793 family protein [Ruminococcus]|uniref:DUF3793 family protein n=1 Tax=Ruminococcus flavefaciens TaxID=1265 RepID=A0A1M7LNI1_RUMFL|nr:MULTISPECIES: DUF3793 family protein [Ruminococcus]MCR4796416.1 DUF3793 family protein [Ruminococcus sp.]SHM79783.1 Protein of unknown function [Ruminococcus flavefaciens]
MSEVERRSIDNVMAFHSAPTLLGVKCANLISFDRNEHTMAEYLHEFAVKLSDSGLCARQLCKCRTRTLVYIYNEKMLSAWLSMPQVRDLLSEYGYPADMSTEEKLLRLASRMSCGSFPHEIGAFLGYPVGDIRGFINNSGKNCLLCGYWKVYENAEKARQTFKTYDRCREILFDRLNHCPNLFRAISKEENI